jgi:hypothetical protein
MRRYLMTATAATVATGLRFVGCGRRAAFPGVDSQVSHLVKGITRTIE